MVDENEGTVTANRERMALNYWMSHRGVEGPGVWK